MGMFQKESQKRSNIPVQSDSSGGSSGDISRVMQSLEFSKLSEPVYILLILILILILISIPILNHSVDLSQHLEDAVAILSARLRHNWAPGLGNHIQWLITSSYILHEAKLTKPQAFKHPERRHHHLYQMHRTREDLHHERRKPS